MGSLSEQQILSRARAASLENVKNLNFWGSDICDVSVLKKMPNVEVLSLSANGIYDLKDFAHCPRLRELYLRRNKVDDIKQIGHLKNLPRLRILWLSDNPCAEEPNYRSTVLKTLPKLTKLDNIVVDPEEVDTAVTGGIEIDTPDDTPCYSDMQDTTNKSILGSSVVNDSKLPEQSVGGKVQSDGGSPSRAQNLVDETNRLRAELGLKQLDINGSSAQNTKKVTKTTTKSPSLKSSNQIQRSMSVDSRNANILSAVVTLVRELDKSSLLELKNEVESRLQEYEIDEEDATCPAAPMAKEVLTG